MMGVAASTCVHCFIPLLTLLHFLPVSKSFTSVTVYICICVSILKLRFKALGWWSLVPRLTCPWYTECSLLCLGLVLPFQWHI